MTKIFDVIRKPLLTEKGQILREKNIQVFEVATWASKHQIREAVELLLQSKVKSVRTVRIPSRTKRLGRFVGTSSPARRPMSNSPRLSRQPSRRRRTITWRTEKLCPLSPAPFNPEARGQP